MTHIDFIALKILYVDFPQRSSANFIHPQMFQEGSAINCQLNHCKIIFNKKKFISTDKT